MFNFLKRKNIYDKDIVKKCAICIYCYDYTTKVVCKYKQNETDTTLDSYCKHFTYDATKRIPLQSPTLPKFNPEDFKL